MDSTERIYKAKDWTKLCALFGEHAFEAEQDLIKKGIYPEFCDGNVVMFYLSPLTKEKHFNRLQKELSLLFAKYPYTASQAVEQGHTPMSFDKNAKTEWVELDKAQGKICASDCGLFPPCTPLIKQGEEVRGEQIQLLKKAANTYGLVDGKMLVVSLTGVIRNEKEKD